MSGGLTDSNRFIPNMPIGMCGDKKSVSHNTVVSVGMVIYYHRGRTTAGSCDSQGAIIPLKTMYIFA